MNQPNQIPNPAAPPPILVAMHADVDVSKREHGGRTSYVVHHRQLGKYFRLGVEEYHVAELLDGSRTVDDIHRQITADGLDWSQAEIAKFVGQLVSQRLATATPQEAAGDRGQAEPEKSAQTAEPNRANSWHRRLPAALAMIVSQRIPLLNGAAAAEKAEPILGPWFSRLGICTWCVLVASGLLIVYGDFASFAVELRRMFDPGIWPILILIWCAAKVLHELGHAVCAKRHGVRVGRMGIMFFMLAPLAYVDVTDAWKLKRRFQRVQIALAGVYVELAVAAVAAWAWWLLPTGFLKHLAAQVFVVAGPATLLVNANPLLRLDGYYVLSDLLEIPNLRMHGRRQLGGMIESLMFSIPRPRSLLVGWRRPTATLHAACSVIFQFFWMTGLIIAASMWVQGLGIVLAVAAFVLWGLLPLSRWTQKIWKLEPVRRWGLNKIRISLMGYGVLVVLAVHHFCTTASPLARRVPVVVRYQDEQIARATADAFVQNVYATRGQRIAKGMLLMELQQPELVLRRQQLNDDLRMAAQREVQYRRQNKIAQARAEAENAQSLSRQISELDEQIAGLRILAERDGLITSANIERLQGAYVHAGDELIRVSDPSEKELLVTVGQEDAQTYQRAVGTNTKVRLRGGTELIAKATPLRPRARQSLPHPALAASVGGPIAVEPTSDEDELVRMIEPQLESVAPLDPVTSSAIHAGQVGTMTISDDRSLITRLVDSMWPKKVTR
jgi:putative peptide zinc metalloprotease protein